MSVRTLIKKAGSCLNLCFIKNPNKILFESNSDYCDNSRALYDYMIENNYDKKYKFVWCVKDVKAFKNKGFKNTKFVSFKNPVGILSYFFQMATAKTIFYTHYVPPFMNTRKQTIVNLWHGTPLKSIKGHAHSAELFSFVLSPSEAFDSVIMDSFDAGKEKLLHCGYPRNDLLFASVNSLERLGINKADYKNVIMWMPTFRRPADGSYQDAHTTKTGIPLIENAKQLLQLNDKLRENNQMMIIKLHPLQDLKDVDLVKFSNIKMLTNSELSKKSIQLYHLVGQCDVLLTDYSSIYFDYLLLNRPIGFIIDDIDEYNQKRGFVVDDPLSIMPGEKIKTIEQLNIFFDNLAGSKDDYIKERARVNDIVNTYRDNHSSKRLIAEMKL